jgi:hypothetical protein
MDLGLIKPTLKTISNVHIQTWTYQESTLMGLKGFSQDDGHKDR